MDSAMWYFIRNQYPGCALFGLWWSGHDPWNFSRGAGIHGYIGNWNKCSKWPKSTLHVFQQPCTPSPSTSEVMRSFAVVPGHTTGAVFLPSDTNRTRLCLILMANARTHSQLSKYGGLRSFTHHSSFKTTGDIRVFDKPPGVYIYILLFIAAIHHRVCHS